MMNTYTPLRVLDISTDLIHYPTVLKLVVVGETMVGKSCLISNCMGEDFYADGFPTIGKC